MLGKNIRLQGAFSVGLVSAQYQEMFLLLTADAPSNVLVDEYLILTFCRYQIC